MSHLIRSVPLLLAFLCVSAADLRAQADYGGPTGRGPLFLRVSAASRAPVRVEPGRVPLLQPRITVRLEDVPLDEALRTISARAGIPLVYSAAVVPLDRRVSLVAEGISVAAALGEVLLDAEVDVVVAGGQVALVRRDREPTQRQTGTIAGRVLSVEAAGELPQPVVGAQVVVEGTGLEAFTDGRGWFSIADVPVGRQSVTVQSIGFHSSSTQEVEVVEGETVTIGFVLEVEPVQLAEIVTTVTGPRRRVELGNDITVLDVDSIMAVAPITSVTDLLDGRVPGLMVQRTSGAPGDPARIRIRGASSPNLSNDPIVVVDGVRTYSRQSDERAGNLAGGANNYAAPSPLDYIDPHTIETIQVIKGPSAATLYGQDAASGVIVITTKRGRPGPARWTVSMEHGITEMVDEYPELYLRWGHTYSEGVPVFCPINNQGGLGGVTCQGDTLARYQMLNDPDLTVLDRGRGTAVSVGVSGGGPALTYNVTGSYRDEVGLIKLPDYEVERYRTEQERALPEWMRRPQNLAQWSASARIRARLGADAHVSLTSNLSRTEQQRSSLERQLGTLMSTYLDETTGIYYQQHPLLVTGIQPTAEILTDYYERATATATQFTNGVNMNWRPRSWLSLSVDAGLNVIQRADEIFIPAGFASGFGSDGDLRRGKGTSMVRTVNLRANTEVPIGLGFRFRFAAGVNYTGRSIDDLTSTATGLAEGTESLNGAANIDVGERRLDQATFGWYVQPGISHNRFWLSTGLRLDGGSTFGTNLELPIFPKVSLSYLISDEPYFPDALQSVFNSLRLRVAYGHAGRQPGPTDRLRLFGASAPAWVGGQIVDAVFLEALGNTELKPERSREFEGGFDAVLLDDRLSVNVTGYRKTTEDALLDVPVAPSVYGRGVSILENIGVIRNEGFEIGLGIEPVRSDLVRWRAQLQLSRNRNIVVELGPGVEPFYTATSTGLDPSTSGGIRVAEGYPLFGRWNKPVLGYADANGNGVLEAQEVLLGDTAVYVGGTLPEYTASLHTTVSLFRGALSVSAGLLYQDGLTQRNQVAERLAPFSRGWNDPSAPLAAQLGVLDLGGYTWNQTVNTLRLNSLSVRYQVPARLARWLGADALSVALQGSNLGLWTNYSGLDPSVNARATGNSVIDTGVLPTPRSWQIRVSASY